jgi:hypothetical protein
MNSPTSRGRYFGELLPFGRCWPASEFCLRRKWFAIIFGIAIGKNTPERLEHLTRQKLHTTDKCLDSR